MDDPLKVKLEQTVAREFLLASRSHFEITRSGIPPEPDVICKHRSTGEQMGIEVVTGYYDTSHAASIWSAARGQPNTPYYLHRPDWHENVKVLAEVLRTIRTKSKKSYTVQGRLVLVAFVYPQRFYLRDVEERLETLPVPGQHPFGEIHVMSQHGELYCLFPDHTWILK